MKLDGKSISMIKNNQLYVPYLKESFNVSNNDVDLNKLADSLKYLKDDIDSTLHLFIERLMELAQIDGKSNDLLKIYNDHVNELATVHKNDLKFSRLLENVENKLRFLDESRNLEEIKIKKD